MIAFVHFITVSSSVFISPLILLLFFECFHFTNFLYRECFLSRTSFLCCGTRECYGFERAFFTLRFFLSYTLSRHLAQPAFIKASLEQASPPTEVRNTDLPISLFESHSVQQNVLVGRFYLCIRGCYRLLS